MSHPDLVPGPAARRERLRVLLPTVSPAVDALLVTELVNVRYLTGFTGSNGALLLPTAGAVLATDSRYLLQAGEQCPDVDLLVERSVAAALVVEAGRRGLRRLGFEATNLSVADHASLTGLASEAGVVLVPLTGTVEALRVVKDSDEVQALRRACEISAQALAGLLPEVHAGLTETRVAVLLETLMREGGAEAPAFETIVASGPHSAVPHHEPTGRQLERGDLLKIDFGARFAGYHADMTRTFTLGPAQPWQQEVHDLVAQAQAAGRAALSPGAELAEVDLAARSLIEAAGYGEHFKHGLGHGVGLVIHEAPMIGYGTTGTLALGTPVTVEPGVYLPGRGGVRIEDTLLVTSDGAESLTIAPRELIELG